MQNAQSKPLMVDYATSTAIHVENFMTGSKITFTFKKSQNLCPLVNAWLKIIRSFFAVETYKL